MWNDACTWTRSRLPLMAGGELSGTDRRKTERHLIGCPDCRNRLESCRGTVDLLRLVGRETGPSAETPSLWPSLAREIRETRREKPVIAIWGMRPLAWAGSAVAACLVLGVGASASWTWLRPETVAAVPPTAPLSTSTVKVAEPLPTKPEATSLAEGPRREEEHPANESAKTAARNTNLPSTSSRTVVEATH